MIEEFRMLPPSRQLLNWCVTVASALACVLVLPTRFPGMELLGIGPNWLLIWIVAWSVRRKRTFLQAGVAGIALGFIQDGMTAPDPSHAVSLAMVGVLTVGLRRLRLIPEDFIEEDFISVALIVFGMAFLAETVTAAQFVGSGKRELAEIWTYHQQVALCSAILSSLWAPVVSFPLNRWGS